MIPPFIVIEGPDGSGSTAQSTLLAKRIEASGHSVLLTAEPTDGPIGKHIRTMLEGPEKPQTDAIQLLFCADRAEHLANEILPALESGRAVVSDRYALSTIVYGSVQGIDEAWLTEINKHFRTPDLTIITLPPFDVCMERIGGRAVNDQYENGELQKKVYDAYAKESGDDILFVDTSKEIGESAEEIWNVVSGLL